MQIKDLRTRLVRDGALGVDGSTPEQFAANARRESEVGKS